MTKKSVRLLPGEVARKIAAGEVIERPSSIVRELLDNAVDSGATKIRVEIWGGGIDKIRVMDNGCGMTKEDLQNCARPHATSKISSEEDLLHLTTLGFRGEALSSMAAVSRLEITSGGFKMRSSVTEDHVISPCAMTEGTISQTTDLFENFPARRQFLKRPFAEGIQCRTIFNEKVLSRPDIEFSFFSDGEEKIFLPKNQTLKERFVQVQNFFESEDLFYEINFSDPEKKFSFSMIIGEPSVNKNSRKEISVYVNGRKIQEYSLVQSVVYGTQGYFPNGTFPVACVFIQIEPSLVDFNIHPAKKEVRFKDISGVHHAISSEVKKFFRTHTVQNLLQQNDGEISAEKNFLFPAEIPDEKFIVDENFSAGKKLHFASPKVSAFYSDVRKKDGRRNFFSAENSEKIFERRQQSFRPNFIPSENEAGDSAENFHFVGSALGTFLIAEKNETLYIIDQHAAHERILYNKIMAESSQRQMLLVPIRIQTESSEDDEYISRMEKKFDEAGFSCRNLGDGQWEFSSVPIRWKGTEADLKSDILDRRISPADMMNAIAASTACRSAVMDGTILDDDTAREIAKEALKLPDPHCPHGRPVFTSITRTQLFSLVKRI
jgi:DNA mismatch repair protein MutL